MVLFTKENCAVFTIDVLVSMTIIICLGWLGCHGINKKTNHNNKLLQKMYIVLQQNKFKENEIARDFTHLYYCVLYIK